MIKVENLSLKSPYKQILKNISFGISRGERVAILGESGSGKSLLLRAILGILPQNIFLEGQISNNAKNGVILQRLQVLHMQRQRSLHTYCCIKGVIM